MCKFNAETVTMSKIWTIEPDLVKINDFNKNTMIEFLDIQFTKYDDDALYATMPVNERTIQSYGILHGGASVVLAETVGSVASIHCVDPEKFRVVGLEINCNHIRATRDGLITCVAKPKHTGRTTQVWEMTLYNEEQKITAISRMTCSVVNIDRIKLRSEVAKD